MSSFWKGKRVFVTGHTGFKGSWLTLWLKSLGAEIYGYALAPESTPNLFTEASVAQQLAKSTIANICDKATLAEAIKHAQPEIVLHLAAQPLVRYSYKNPIETYTTNVIGTVNLLDILRKTDSVKAIVNVTTDKCYENQETSKAFSEREPLGGYDPYSSSKACAEIVTAAYRQSYFNELNIGVATARAGNVIGGGDWSDDRLIPDFFRALDKSETLIIRSPHAIRPWQHVLESLAGYLLLAENLYTQGKPFAGAWNFGPPENDAKTVSWILDQLTMLSPSASWQVDTQPNPHEATYLKLDSSKSQEKLNWQTKWTLETSLNKIIDWHLAWQANKDMHAFCLSQIGEYTATESLLS